METVVVVVVLLVVVIMRIRSGRMDVVVNIDYHDDDDDDENVGHFRAVQHHQLPPRGDKIEYSFHHSYPVRHRYIHATSILLLLFVVAMMMPSSSFGVTDPSRVVVIVVPLGVGDDGPEPVATLICKDNSVYGK